MALNRDVNLLEPITRAKAIAALGELKSLGIAFFINETLRARIVQGCYWLQSRAPLEIVNLFRREASLWPITEAENKNPVTKTIQSKHLLGKAIDVVPALPDGSPNWKASMAEYQKIAIIMKKHGFLWGGDWKGFTDCPHYETP